MEQGEKKRRVVRRGRIRGGRERERERRCLDGTGWRKERVMVGLVTVTREGEETQLITKAF